MRSPLKRGARGRTAVAALAAVTAALAAVPGGASADVAYRGLDLISLRPATTQGEVDAALAAAGRLGANTVRIDAPWDLLEPTGAGSLDPGAIDLLDRAVAGASARGIGVILVVQGTPCWASSAPETYKRHCGPGEDTVRTFSYPPFNASDYGRIAGTLASRYRGHLLAYEVWNEPDHANEYYLAGPDKPYHYAALLKAAYPAIKAADPSVQVLAGSLVGGNGAFLQALYSQGIKGFYDGLSVHFYDLVFASLRAVRAVQLAHGDRAPLWLAETGWSSCYPGASEQGGQLCVTAPEQAANITDLMAQVGRASYLRSVLVYALQDTAQYAFGLLDVAGAPKPAFGALARALAAPTTISARPLTLTLRGPRGRVVASGSAPAGDTLELTASRGRRAVYRASFRLNRDERFAIRLPGAASARGVRVTVTQAWSRLHAGAVVR